MKVKVNTDFERLQLRAREAINFMEDHPAMSDITGGVLSCLWLNIETCCKRGYSDSAGDSLQIYWRSKMAKKFKKEFEEEFKNYTEEQLKIERPFVSIDVPYKKLFGEDWKFDHVEYWGELSFFMFKGRPTRKESYRRENWQPYAGPETGGRTFEEMIINIAKEFRRDYGNFRREDFLTKEEKENHRKVSPFKFVPINIKGKKGYSRMVRGKGYIDVSDAELNLRWQKWFKTSKLYKERWAKT